MAEYQLYCFAQSGNAYRAALMLNLIGADWEPIWVDFFVKGEQRAPAYRTNVNEMGEVPVLVHGSRKLSQSGVILSYLAEGSGKFAPDGEDEWRHVSIHLAPINPEFEAMEFGPEDEHRRFRVIGEFVQVLEEDF